MHKKYILFGRFFIFRINHCIMELEVGQVYTSGNSKITIVDKDKLCYLVKSLCGNSSGLRTISKPLLEEFVSFFRNNPDASAVDARKELTGKSSIDRFEYGYASTLKMMSDLLFINEQTLTHGSIASQIDSKQIIYYGAPGTGKSHAIKVQTKGEDVIRTTFHPDSDYSTFVGSYKPTTKEVPVISTFGGKAIKVKDDNGNELKEERIVYEFVSQAFLQAYVEAWKKLANAGEAEPKKQFLVIEEINRGNCAQIFGDLFQLLDRNDNGFSEYPIKADTDLRKQLKKLLSGLTINNAVAINALYESDDDVVGKVLDGDVLLLPNNLYIWATMNTSDQSLFPIDSAFKRRWDWQYVPIANADKGWKIQVYGKNYDWWDFIEKVNALIGDTTNSEDKKLGYFFCKPTDGVITAEAFVSKVIFYLWNDVFKDFEFDGDAFIDEDNQTKLTFDKFYRTDATGKPAVRENKVDLFLSNLGVAFSDEEDDNNDFDNNQNVDDGSLENEGANTNPAGGRDHSRYSINGQGSFNKRKLALECVKIYSSNHSELTAKEIADVFLGLNLMLSGFIELRDEHLAKAASVNDSQFERRYYELTLPNEEIIFINNQFTVERINDFIEKVNAQNWNIHIEKVE